MSASDIVIWLFVVLGLAVVGGLVWWLVAARSRKTSLSGDAPIVFSWVPEHSRGHAVGIELRSESRYENRKLVSFLPLDREYVDGSPVKVEAFDVPVKNMRRLTFPVGKLSAYRNVVMWLPDRASGIPEELQETELGAALAITTEMRFTRDRMVDILKKGGEEQTKVLKMLQQGEMSEALMRKVREMNELMVNKPLVAVARKQGLPFDSSGGPAQ